MGLACVRNVDPEHGPECGYQDAMAFLIDLNNGAVETSVFRQARGSDETEEEKTGEEGEKRRTHI